MQPLNECCNKECNYLISAKAPFPEITVVQVMHSSSIHCCKWCNHFLRTSLKLCGCTVLVQREHWNKTFLRQPEITVLHFGNQNRSHSRSMKWDSTRFLTYFNLQVDTWRWSYCYSQWQGCAVYPRDTQLRYTKELVAIKNFKVLTNEHHPYKNAALE